MHDSAFVIFIVFGCIWLLMASTALIAFFKVNGQEIKISKTGLLVALPIILPIVITLTYAAIKGTF